MAIRSAAIRSRRLGSAFSSSVSPQNWTEKPTRAPSVLANSLLPVPGGAVEEQVHAAARRASEISGGRDDPSGEIAQVAEMLEVVPGQRGAGGFAEQEIADPARVQIGARREGGEQRVTSAGFLRLDQTQFGKSASGRELDPLGVRLEERLKVRTVHVERNRTVVDRLDKTADLGRSASLAPKDRGLGSDRR